MGVWKREDGCLEASGSQEDGCLEAFVISNAKNLLFINMRPPLDIWTSTCIGAFGYARVRHLNIRVSKKSSVLSLTETPLDNPLNFFPFVRANFIQLPVDDLAPMRLAIS
jgi:hypothetical protein